MTSASAVINDRTKAIRARSYVPFYGDVSYPKDGKLGRAPEITFDDAAGSITATPGDMSRYLQMLLNRGQHAQGRIVSEASFADFSKPYIEAPEFSPTASYGYGVAVDELDGHKILRHTGGMVSFASSIHVDLDGGVAAFASINAMQGYRPVPVTQFAVQMLNAQAKSMPRPPSPALPDGIVADAGDYAGTYTSNAGTILQVLSDGSRVRIMSGKEAVPLERASGDVFLARADGWDRFPLVFGRGDVPAGSKDKGLVVELAHGGSWYAKDGYKVPAAFAASPELERFTGFYQSDSAWSGSVRIVLRKGILWADGVTPFQPIGNAIFRVGEESYVPDTAEFHHVVDGKAQMMKWNGADFLRIAME
jgi:hypothetical protein